MGVWFGIVSAAHFLELSETAELAWHARSSGTANFFRAFFKGVLELQVIQIDGQKFSQFSRIAELPAFQLLKPL